MPEPLNTYETRLLDELQTHLANRPCQPTPRRRIGPAIRLAAAAGVSAMSVWSAVRSRPV